MSTDKHIAGRPRGWDILDVLDEHFHSPSKCYPTLAAGVDVLSGAAWTLGNFTEIIPADTIPNDFDLHYVVLENATDDESYELVFYAAEIEIGRIRFAADNPAGNRITVGSLPIQTEIQKKNTQIQAKLASSGAAETVTISVHYHTY